MSTKPMCPHCQGPIAIDGPFTEKIESGIAYAQICRTCNHKVGVRPRLPSDPEPTNCFNEKEIEYLKFTKYRLSSDIQVQLEEIR